MLRQPPRSNGMFVLGRHRSFPRFVATTYLFQGMRANQHVSAQHLSGSVGSRPLRHYPIDRRSRSNPFAKLHFNRRLKARFAHGLMTDKSASHSWLYQEFTVLRDSLENLVKRADSNRKRVVLGCLLGILVTGATVVLRWDKVKNVVGKKGAQVLEHGMMSEELQFSASAFSKELIDDLLHDQRLKNMVARYVEEILHSPVVIGRIYDISKGIARKLCNDPEIQANVANLLLTAINLPLARNGAASWAIDLIHQQDVRAALQEVVQSNILKDKGVRDSAYEFASDIVTRVLADPETKALSQKHVSQVLEDEKFQTSASNSLWTMVKMTLAPKWFSPRSLPQPEQVTEMREECIQTPNGVDAQISSLIPQNSRLTISTPENDRLTYQDPAAVERTINDGATADDQKLCNNSSNLSYKHRDVPSSANPGNEASVTENSMSRQSMMRDPTVISSINKGSMSSHATSNPNFAEITVPEPPSAEPSETDPAVHGILSSAPSTDSTPASES